MTIYGLEPMDYANLWGDTNTPTGRTMYSTADQAESWGRKEWANFIAAASERLSDVLAKPSDYDEGDDADLEALIEWAKGHYVATR
jgi:hypothetical protein